jgi:DNA ligase-1
MIKVKFHAPWINDKDSGMLLSKINHVKAARGYYNDWNVTEKFDGRRCLWIPATEGLLIKNVPFANISRKPRLANRVSTGLWTRAWCPIFAPEWWVEELKRSHDDIQFALDGELWTGFKQFEKCSEIIAQEQPDERWQYVSFLASGCIPLNMFAEGTVGGIKLVGVARWLRERGMRYDFTYRNNLFVPIIGKGKDRVKLYEDVLSHDGEGVVLRYPYLNYTCERSNLIVKMKPHEDDIAICTGYTAGLKANIGRLGALICDFNGVTFKLSGMSREQRRLNESCDEFRDGEELPPNYSCLAVPIGSGVHFKYRELTKYDVPKEASFIEVMEDE